MSTNNDYLNIAISKFITLFLILYDLTQILMIHIKKFTYNDFQECCYLAWDETSEAAIVDPGFINAAERDLLYGFIMEKGLIPKKILLTHGHFDHVYGLKECAEKFGLPIFMNPDDTAILQGADWFLRRYGITVPDTSVTTCDIADGDTVGFGNTSFLVISTPGHSPGCVCYLDTADKVMFSGDTLFAGSIGRTDHPGGDYDILMKSIMERLMTLDGDIDVLPGHGRATTIAEERTRNPFLQPFYIPDDTDE